MPIRLRCLIFVLFFLFVVASLWTTWMVTPRELTIREGKVIEEVAKRAVLPPPDSELRVGYEDDDDNAAKPHIVRIRKIPYGIEILQDFGPVEFPQSTTSSPPPIARR